MMVMEGQFQAGRDKLAQAGRCEKLAVLKLFLGFTELMVVLIIAPLQPMEAAVARIGIVDVLGGNGTVFQFIAGYQVEDFFI